MKAHPYFWFVLTVLALIGMGLAMSEATKPGKDAEHPRWTFWMLVMGVLVVFDTAALKWLSEE